MLTWLLASGMGYYYFGLLLPRAFALRAAARATGGYVYGADLYPVWLTGRELLQHRRNPYSQQMTQDIQTGLFGRPLNEQHLGDPAPEYRSFAYPLYTDLLALPLLPWSFRAVRIAIAFLLPWITAGGVLLWMRVMKVRLSWTARAICVLLTLSSYPVLAGLYAQQLTLFVAAALAAAMWAIESGRLALGGVLLALCTVKPQLAVLLVAWLLLWSAAQWNRRRGLIVGFLLTMAALLIASYLVLPGWIGDWWNTLIKYRHYTRPPLAELVLGRFAGRAVVLLWLVLLGFAGWRVRNEPQSSAAATLVAAFSLAVAAVSFPMAGAVYDHVILVPAVFWVISRRYEFLRGSVPVRVTAILTGCVLFWPWVTASVFAARSLFFTANISEDAVLLPLRTAASFPLALLALISLSLADILRKRGRSFPGPGVAD
jgi:hypothetical protein